MGAAARQRGDAIIRRQAEDAIRDPSKGVWPILDRLDQIDAGTLRQLAKAGVVRPDPGVPGRFWLMNRKEDGWASFGRIYRSLDEVRRAYALRFTGYNHDEHGPYWAWEALPCG